MRFDNVLLNGDTTTAASGNINSDQRGALRPRRSTWRWMGLRHLPLGGQVGQCVQSCMGAAPTLAKMRETRFKMPGKYAARPIGSGLGGR